MPKAKHPITPASTDETAPDAGVTETALAEPTLAQTPSVSEQTAQAAQPEGHDQHPRHGHHGRHHKPKKHKAQVEHQVPGRIRMKIQTAKSNPAMLEAYCNAFSIIPGVSKVQARPDTGSIVIFYDTEHHDALHAHLHETCANHDTHFEHGERVGDEVEEIVRQFENEAEFLAQRSHIARVTVDFFKGFDREMKTLTDNTIDLKIVLAGGLAAFTFLEIGAEAATPMWVTLALFSLNHFAELHPNPPTPEASASR
jgi:hypothetical protein